MKSNQLTGTLGGSLLAIAGTMDVGDLYKTALLAAIGAVVSFLVSTLMKIISRRIAAKGPGKKT